MILWRIYPTTIIFSFIVNRVWRIVRYEYYSEQLRFVNVVKYKILILSRLKICYSGMNLKLL